jgi:phosphoribosylamine--glycine ligase
VAVLEGSKVFAKELMRRLNVPTADFTVFDELEPALEHIEKKHYPIVVKADGLAAGKGVIVAKTREEAREAIRKMMVEKAFGEAGAKIIIEDCLVGEEASIIVLSDGINVIPLASSQDHKRVYDSDRGPNTGGMGAYSPAPIVTDELLKTVMERAIIPVIKGLAKEKVPYKGALYAGIMVTEDGPKVLEFNVRFGDPETQAILPRLKSDLAEALERSADGKLAGYSLQWDPRACVSVVLASGGYPGEYRKGAEIEGLDEAKKMEDVFIFHAGTKPGKRATDTKNLFITDGGRVLNVTALGQDIKKALDNCYDAVKNIRFDKMHYRKDIAARAVKPGGEDGK